MERDSKQFHKNQEQDKVVPFLHTYSIRYLKSLKKIKVIKIGTEKVKVSLLAVDMTGCVVT